MSGVKPNGNWEPGDRAVRGRSQGASSLLSGWNTEDRGREAQRHSGIFSPCCSRPFPRPVHLTHLLCKTLLPLCSLKAARNTEVLQRLPVSPMDLLRWRRCSLSAVICGSATGHVHLLSVWNMASVTEEQSWKFYHIKTWVWKAPCGYCISLNCELGCWARGQNTTNTKEVSDWTWERRKVRVISGEIPFFVLRNHPPAPCTWLDWCPCRRKIPVASQMGCDVLAGTGEALW